MTTKTPAKQKKHALFVDCPGLSNQQEHEMRDHCYSCAPFWRRVPLCPVHRGKLTTTGWCKWCRTHYETKEGAP